MWRIAGQSEYLAITGGFIRDVKLAKKAWIWPTQKCVKFDVSPVTCTFKLQVSSPEKLPFFFNAIFAIGPHVTDHKSLLLYAKLIASQVNLSSHVRDLVPRIIKGHVVAGPLTMEHILKGILEKLQLELDLFGLLIVNAKLVDAKRKAMINVPLEIPIKVEGALNVRLASKKDTWSRSSELAKVDAEQEAVTIHLDTTGRQSKVEIKAEGALRIRSASKKVAWCQSSGLAKLDAKQNTVTIRFDTIGRQSKVEINIKRSVIIQPSSSEKKKKTHRPSRLNRSRCKKQIGNCCYGAMFK